MNESTKVGIGIGIGLAIVGLIVFLCWPSSCDNPPTCKFDKGTEVTIKSSRWAKRGSVTDVWVNGDCECMYEVSQTTWIEGRRKRTFSEYELEEEGKIDSEAWKILKEVF